MPRIVDSERQRRDIRVAARRVFAARGLHGTGLAHVAEAAGMGRSSLYHYYPDRRALIRDLVSDLLHEEEAAFAEVLSGQGSPLARIERLAWAMVPLIDAWTSLGRVLLDLRVDAARFRRFFRRVRGDLAELVREGQREGEVDASLDAEGLAATLIGAVDGLLLQRIVDPDVLGDRERLGRVLVTTFRKVLAP